MPAAPLLYVVGVRLNKADMVKLTRLCRHTSRNPSDLLRLLIRLVEPTTSSVMPLTLRHRIPAGL